MSRIIRRYPNRRLYDTEESRYVSLDDLKRLVLNATPFEVHDSKTNEDVTRSVLLQILFDQESQSTPLFSDTLLRSFICFYSHPMGASVIAPYLEKSLEVFQRSYQQWTQHLSPEQLTTQAWQQAWQQHLQPWLNPLTQSTNTPPPTWNPWATWWPTFNTPPNQDTAKSEQKDPTPPKK